MDEQKLDYNEIGPWGVLFIFRFFGEILKDKEDNLLNFENRLKWEKFCLKQLFISV
jgi:hypothetical protein